MSLVEELVEFLGAFKSAESLSPDLRVALSVNTQLEKLLMSAIDGGRTVLITGAAGSGKTHLLRGLLPPKGTQLATAGSKPKARHILVVPDATELTVEERIAAAHPTAGRMGTIIAINEGPLRETAQAHHGDVFQAGATLLHRAQRGAVDRYDPRLPTVIDMGAFDPVQHHVLRHVLKLPLLREAIARRTCGCTPEECPRVLAWRQLENEDVRSRISDLCSLILLADTDWSFRDLWDFVADLVLEGECDDDPPSSTWFWRVFYGGSRLSAALREVCDPESLALPGVDQRLWYADWDARTSQRSMTSSSRS